MVSEKYKDQYLSGYGQGPPPPFCAAKDRVGGSSSHKDMTKERSCFRSELVEHFVKKEIFESAVP